nr:unnamed protein product [Callosobruchus analis]
MAENPTGSGPAPPLAGPLPVAPPPLPPVAPLLVSYWYIGLEANKLIRIFKPYFTCQELQELFRTKSSGIVLRTLHLKEFVLHLPILIRLWLLVTISLSLIEYRIRNRVNTFTCAVSAFYVDSRYSDFKNYLVFLITLVEAQPVLWDKTTEKYKNKLLTKNAWKDVCCALNPTFNHTNDGEKQKLGMYL